MPRYSSLLIFFLIFFMWLGFVYEAMAMGRAPLQKDLTTPVVTLKKKNRREYEYEVKALKVEYSAEGKAKLSWKSPDNKNFGAVVIIVRSDRYPQDAWDYDGKGRLLVDMMGEPAKQMSYAYAIISPRWTGAISRSPNQYYLVVCVDKDGNYSKGTKGFLTGVVR